MELVNQYSIIRKQLYHIAFLIFYKFCLASFTIVQKKSTCVDLIINIAWCDDFTLWSG